MHACLGGTFCTKSFKKAFFEVSFVSKLVGIFTKSPVDRTGGKDHGLVEGSQRGLEGEPGNGQRRGRGHGGKRQSLQGPDVAFILSRRQQLRPAFSPSAYLFAPLLL